MGMAEMRSGDNRTSQGSNVEAASGAFGSPCTHANGPIGTGAENSQNRLHFTLQLDVEELFHSYKSL